MTYIAIAHDGQGYRIYQTEFGIDRTFVGPRWNTPREAARYAALIEVPYIDPLRVSAEDASANTGSLPVDGTASSAESRIRDSRRIRQRRQ